MAPLASPTTLGLTCAFTFVAFTAFALRLKAARVVGQDFGADIWIFSFGMLMILAQLICTIVAAAVAGCAEPKLPSAQEATFQSKMLFIDPFFNGPAGAAIKVAVLLFYKTIFIKQSFHWACNIQIGLVVGWAISFMLGTLFQHDPISGAWHLTGGHQRIDFATFALTIFGINIGLDLITLCLPLPLIHSLQMSTRRKLQITGIFWLGLFAVVASSVRLYYSYVEVASAIPVSVRAARTTSVYLWSRIEPCASAVAACLPTYGPLFRRGRSLNSFLQGARSVFSLRSRKKDSSAREKSSKDSETKTKLPVTSDNLRPSSKGTGTTSWN